MLHSRSLCGLVLFLLLASITFGCSDETSEEESDDVSQDAGGPDAADDLDDAEVPQDGETDAETDDGPLASNCPNNIWEPDLREQCDDGNYFDEDGCTRLCEFSCEEDDDCDDLNDCNGKETCNDGHACEPGEWAENEDICGSNKSCFEGLCLDDVCGDNVTNEGLGEDCDDGNNINDDECSNRCTYGCISDDDCRDGDPCAGTTTCDVDSHKCSGPTLADKSLCETTTIEDGWCMKNVCVPTDCGDGEQEGSEDCDEGKDNGTAGSPCSIDCRIVECGNGTIEGSEECDDGNEVSMDSCDENCRAEIYFRWNRLEILRELAPEWCVNPGKNAFAAAFPGAVEILSIVTVDVLKELNDEMAAPIEECELNYIVQVLNLADPSFKTSDDKVDVAIHFGELASGQSCESPLGVDSEFYFDGDSIEDGEPASTMGAIQRPGVLQSADAIDLAANTESDSRAGALLDFKFLWQMDTENLSTPEYLERDDGLDALQLPETMGVNPDPGDPYHASGRLCAAMSMDGMAGTKIRQGDREEDCCSSEDSVLGVSRKYVGCPPDDPDGDCDTVADLMINGCTVCIEGLGVSEDCAGGNLDNCDISFEVVRPSPPDIDTDGDGEKDALSIVFGVEGVRARSRGIKE